MRLKFLFFPVSLIISIFVFVGYVWPQIVVVKGINKEYSKNQEDMNTVKEKQAAIQAVAANLADNKAGQEAVLNYLPNSKSEERILNGISNITTDAGVLLGNVLIKNNGGVTGENRNFDSAGLSQLALATTANTQATADIAQQGLGNATQLQVIGADISVSGTYEKIRIFTENLQKMNMFNSIKSFKISQGEVDPGSLFAEISVDFSYLPIVKVDSQRILNIQSSLDVDTIKSLNNNVSKTGSEINIGQTGKTNPFLP